MVNHRLLQVVFLNVKAAFDLVDRCALWKALRSKCIPDVLVDIMAALHQHTGSKVCHKQKLSAPFPTTLYTRPSIILRGNRLDS